MITYSDKYSGLGLLPWFSLVNVSVSVKAAAFRYKKDNVKAKAAFEKASKGQEILSSYPFVLKLKMWFFCFRLSLFVVLVMSFTNLIDLGMLLNIWSLLVL